MTTLKSVGTEREREPSVKLQSIYVKGQLRAKRVHLCQEELVKEMGDALRGSTEQKKGDLKCCKLQARQEHLKVRKDFLKNLKSIMECVSLPSG